MFKTKTGKSQFISRFIFATMALTPITESFCRDTIRVERMIEGISTGYINPAMIDSVNLKGSKFDFESLITNYISDSMFSNEIISSDSMGIFSLDTDSAGRKSYIHKFYLRSDRYAKVDIEFKSNAMAALFVDGEKMATDACIKEPITECDFTSASVTMEPGQKEIVIKTLSSESNQMVPSLSINVIANKNGEKAVIGCYTTSAHPVRVEDMMIGDFFTSVSVSPDGKYLLTGVKNVDASGETSYETFITEVKSGRKNIVSKSWKHMSWLPKSGLLMYMTSQGNKNNIRTLNPRTLEDKLFAANVPDSYFSINKDEKYLVFNVSDSDNKAQSGDIRRILSPAERSRNSLSSNNIFIYDIKSASLRQATFGYHYLQPRSVGYSTDRIYFSQSGNCITERPFTNTSLYSLDVNTFAIDTLFCNEKFAGSISLMPQGSELFVIGSAEAFGRLGVKNDSIEIPNYFDRQLYVFDVASKQPKAMTKDFNPSVEYAFRTWNGKYLLVCEDKDYNNLYEFDPRKNTFTKLNISPDCIANYSITPSGDKIAYYGTKVDSGNKLYVYDLKSGKETMVDMDLNNSTDDLLIGDVKDWKFASADGTQIEGRYYLPFDFDPAKSYPMIVYYYGGTSPTSRAFYHPYSMHQYASQGYVMLVLQPSGTTGLGEEFAARHVNAWGKQTADDIITGTKEFCRQNSFINKEKIGCMGASYGGFMTMYLQTQTDIFAAAISHAGISNIASYWGEGYWGYSYSAIATAENYPWNNRELYTNQSPLFMADKINTPLLLLHGSADTNVPIGESIQMFNALKILGKEVELIQITGENHGISDFRKRLGWKKTIFAYFAKHLKDDALWWNELYPEKNLE